MVVKMFHICIPSITNCTIYNQKIAIWESPKVQNELMISLFRQINAINKTYK